MTKHISKFLLGSIVAALLAMPTQAKEPSSVVAEALALAEQQQFNAALGLLQQQDLNSKITYEHRFARARILSWSGYHTAAHDDYFALLQDYPQDPDIMVGAAYLSYYTGNYDIASQYFTAVLKTTPTTQMQAKG